MVARGSLHTIDRAKQLHDFQHIKIGNITPTDLDGFIDYRGRAFVFFELKHVSKIDEWLEAEFDGQRVALERLVMAVGNAGLKCALFAAEHESSPDDVVDAAQCAVRAIYYKSKWTTVRAHFTLRDLTYRFVGLNQPALASEQPTATVLQMPRSRADGVLVDVSGLGRRPSDPLDISPHVSEIFK